MTFGQSVGQADVWSDGDLCGTTERFYVTLPNYKKVKMFLIVL